MSYVQDFKVLSPRQIEEMSDDQLFLEIKRFKKLIHSARKSGEDTRLFEEEVCYLQAAAQNRGHEV